MLDKNLQSPTTPPPPQPLSRSRSNSMNCPTTHAPPPSYAAISGVPPPPPSYPPSSHHHANAPAQLPVTQSFHHPLASPMLSCVHPGHPMQFSNPTSYAPHYSGCYAETSQPPIQPYSIAHATPSHQQLQYVDCSCNATTTTTTVGLPPTNRVGQSSSSPLPTTTINPTLVPQGASGTPPFYQNGFVHHHHYHQQQSVMVVGRSPPLRPAGPHYGGITTVSSPSALQPSSFFGMAAPIAGSIHLQGAGGVAACFPSRSSAHYGLSDSSTGRGTRAAQTPGHSAYSSANNDSDVNSTAVATKRASSSGYSSANSSRAPRSSCHTTGGCGDSFVGCKTQQRRSRGDLKNLSKAAAAAAAAAAASRSGLAPPSSRTSSASGERATASPPLAQEDSDATTAACSSNPFVNISTRITADEQQRRRRPMSPPQNSTAAPTVKKAPLEELTPHRIDQRFKQIRYGKVTRGYRQYRLLVPKFLRQVGNPHHPETPRDEAHVSKRNWDEMMREWRRALHSWDAVETPEAALLLRHPGLPTRLELDEQDEESMKCNLGEHTLATEAELKKLQQDVDQHIEERRARKILRAEEDATRAAIMDHGSAITTYTLTNEPPFSLRAPIGQRQASPLKSPSDLSECDSLTPTPQGVTKTPSVTRDETDLAQENPPSASTLVAEIPSTRTASYEFISEWRQQSEVNRPSSKSVPPQTNNVSPKCALHGRSPIRPRRNHAPSNTHESSRYATEGTHASVGCQQSSPSPAPTLAVAAPATVQRAPRHRAPPHLADHTTLLSPIKQPRVNGGSTPPRGGMSVGSSGLGHLPLPSSHRDSPIAAAPVIFQPWHEVLVDTLIPPHRATVYIIHIDASAVTGGPQRSTSSLQRQRGSAPPPVATAGGGNQNPTNSPTLQADVVDATHAAHMTQPPKASRPPLCQFCTAAAALNSTSAFSGSPHLGVMIPPMSSPSTFERQRDRYLLDLHSRPVDVLKAFRSELGLYTDKLSFVHPSVSEGWEESPVTAQSLFNMAEQQLHTIEDTADWMKLSEQQPISTAPAPPPPAALQQPTEAPSCDPSPHAFHQRRLSTPLFVLSRGPPPRSQSCDTLDLAASGSMTTPLLYGQRVSPHTPSKSPNTGPAPTSPSAGQAGASSSGVASSSCTVLPAAQRCAVAPGGPTRVRENSIVSKNGSMSCMSNESLLFFHQRSFWTTRTPDDAEEASASHAVLYDDEPLVACVPNDAACGSGGATAASKLVGRDIALTPLNPGRELAQESSKPGEIVFDPCAAGDADLSPLSSVRAAAKVDAGIVSGSMLDDPLVLARPCLEMDLDPTPTFVEGAEDGTHQGCTGGDLDETAVFLDCNV